MLSEPVDSGVGPIGWPARCPVSVVEVCLEQPLSDVGVRPERFALSERRRSSVDRTRSFEIDRPVVQYVDTTLVDVATRLIRRGP